MDQADRADGQKHSFRNGKAACAHVAKKRTPPKAGGVHSCVCVSDSALKIHRRAAMTNCAFRQPCSRLSRSCVVRFLIWPRLSGGGECASVPAEVAASPKREWKGAKAHI
eukprot:1910940-Pleurochrysis_carterae.AAC.2